LLSKIEYCYHQVIWEVFGVKCSQLESVTVTMLVTMAVSFSPRAACEPIYIVDEYSTPFSISKCAHILGLHCFRFSYPLLHPRTGVKLLPSTTYIEIAGKTALGYLSMKHWSRAGTSSWSWIRYSLTMDTYHTEAAQDLMELFGLWRLPLFQDMNI